MRSNALDIRPVAGAIGAEIHGVDLRELDEPTVAAIRRVWLDHLVVFFRGQDLTPAQLVGFARRIGEPVEYPFLKGLDGFPEITPVIKLEHERVNFGGIWHSDTAYLERPPMASMLLAREVPPQGGDTLFANMYLAYESLSEGMRRLLDGLIGVNSSARADVSKTREDRLKDAAREDAAREYVAEHPVVRTHPETGRKALYVNRGHTARFAGMTEEESAARIPLRAPDAARVHLPLPLGGRLAGAVGQSLRPALPAQRLSRLPPHHAPGDLGGGSAALVTRPQPSPELRRASPGAPGRGW
jgi:alpha-ketoglutarate-dependent taurine dioxygenase